MNDHSKAADENTLRRDNSRKERIRCKTSCNFVDEIEYTCRYANGVELRTSDVKKLVFTHRITSR